MRFKDYLSIITVSVAIGFVLSVICYFIWTDLYSNTTNSFWISWILLGIISLPIGYLAAKSGSTCPSCSKPFVLSQSGQTDIENFVIYKSESVTENDVTRTKNVPYNCRRYYQHMKCDYCGHHFKFEARSESKA